MTQEFKQMNRDIEAKKYWEGRENKFIRAWVYAQRGLQEFNEFKYFILAFATLVGLIYLKVSLAMVIGVVIASAPIALYVLIRFGRWHVNKAAKTESWILSEYSNPLGYRDYNLKVRTLEELKEINKKLDKLK